MKKLAILTVHVLMFFVVALLLPAGAVAETTQCIAITAVPTTIKLPGIYCFTKNLISLIAGGNAITITTSDVTIDMNGYILQNGSGFNSDTHGIRADNQYNIAIRNGTIRAYRWGITLVGGGRHLVEEVFLDGNRLAGFNLVGINGAVIRKNRVVVHDAEPGAFAVYLNQVSSVTIISNEIMIDSPRYPAFGIQALRSSSIIEKNQITQCGGSTGTTVGLDYENGMGSNVPGGLLIDNRFGGPLFKGLICAINRVTVRDNLVSPEVVNLYSFGVCMDAGNNN